MLKEVPNSHWTNVEVIVDNSYAVYREINAKGLLLFTMQSKYAAVLFSCMHLFYFLSVHLSVEPQRKKIMKTKIKLK